jgi:hypothetical protein
MLQRYSQVGEYYLMQAPAYVEAGTKHFMDIVVYDEERDVHATIKYRDALVATGLFQEEGKAQGNNKGVPATGDLTFDPVVAQKNLKLSNGRGDKQNLMELSAWAVSVKKLLAASEGGTVPEEADKKAVVCVARPFIEHSMLSAILCVAGADTGATLFGPSDMRTPRIRGRTHTLCDYRQTPTFELLSRVPSQRSRPTRRSRRSRGARHTRPFRADVVSAWHPLTSSCRMSVHSHYTGHFKSVITKPQNVLVMRDLMANGYRAGGNTKFFGFEQGRFKVDVAKEQIGARLNFEADAGEDPVYASMLAFPMDSAQAETIHNEITVTSRLLPWETHNPNGRDGFPGGADMYGYYKSAFGLEQIHYGEDLRASQNMEYMSQGSTNNSLCFTGPYRSFDSVTKAFTAFRAGAGTNACVLWNLSNFVALTLCAVSTRAFCARSRPLGPRCPPGRRPLAPRRVGLDAKRTRADAQLRAGPVHWPHQDLSARRAERQDSDAQVGPSSREGVPRRKTAGVGYTHRRRRIQVSSQNVISSLKNSTT